MRVSSKSASRISSTRPQVGTIYLTNFATKKTDRGYPDFAGLQQRLNRSAKKFGINNIISWDRDKLRQTAFYHEHKDILDQIKGAGYWLWKPFIIHKLINEVNEGDIVLYLDSDMLIVNDPGPLIELCIANQGFFLVELRDPARKNRYWIKRDCFHFLGLDTSYYHDQFLSPGGIQIYQKNPLTLEFVSHLFTSATMNKHMLTDEPNICGKPNLEGFKEHRHDQGVLSLLRAKYAIEGFRWPTQWGNHDKMHEFRVEGEWLAKPYSDKPYINSPYGTILFHGRDKSPLRRALRRLTRSTQTTIMCL